MGIPSLAVLGNKMPASASVAKETRKGVVTFRAQPRNGPSAGGFQSRGEAWDYLRIIGEDVLALRGCNTPLHRIL